MVNQLLEAKRDYLKMKQNYLEVKVASVDGELQSQMSGGAFGLGYFKDMMFPDKIQDMNVSCSKRAVSKTNVKNASALVQEAFLKFSKDIEIAFNSLHQPKDIDAMATLVNSYVKIMKTCSSSKKKAFRHTSDKLILLKKRLSAAVIDLEHGDMSKEGEKLKIEQKVAKLRIEVETLEATVGKVTATPKKDENAESE